MRTETVILQKGDLIVEVVFDLEYQSIDTVKNVKTGNLLTSRHPLVKQLVNNLLGVYCGKYPKGITRIKS